MNEQVRPDVIHTTKHLIVALRNVLLKLEVTAAPDGDRGGFAELKKILNQRIDELESCVAGLPSEPQRAKTQPPADS